MSNKKAYLAGTSFLLFFLGSGSRRRRDELPFHLYIRHHDRHRRRFLCPLPIKKQKKRRTRKVRFFIGHQEINNTDNTRLVKTRLRFIVRLLPVTRKQLFCVSHFSIFCFCSHLFLFFCFYSHLSLSST